MAPQPVPLLRHHDADLRGSHVACRPTAAEWIRLRRVLLSTLLWRRTDFERPWRGGPSPDAYLA
jgi:hypothetical protein